MVLILFFFPSALDRIDLKHQMSIRFDSLSQGRQVKNLRDYEILARLPHIFPENAAIWHVQAISSLNT
jgi:hypothetical protein